MLLSTNELARYSQQIKLNEIGVAGQKKLKEARVLCVGAGGLASSLLLYLAAAGVGTIGIIDDDMVEISNLQRQILYRASHIGSKKVHVASSVLMTLNPHVNVITYSMRLSAMNAAKVIALYDIVIDCSDNFATRYVINDTCYQINKPFVFASIFQFEGQCSTFDGRIRPCFRCLFPVQPAPLTALDCRQGGVIGVLPGLLGIIQATEVIKYLLNLGDLLVGRLLCINILTMQFREFRISANPECDICVGEGPRDVAKGRVNDFISAEELQKKLQNKDNIVLLDVRSLEERESHHIGGKPIPLEELSSRLTELNPLDDIIIYCHLGQRSLHAVELLKKANFHSVKSLEGGLKAWRNQSY